jgi:hypothetical protein
VNFAKLARMRKLAILTLLAFGLVPLGCDKQEDKKEEKKTDKKDGEEKKADGGW